MRQGHPHPRLQQRLSRRHELSVYGSAAVLSLSGVAWLICHYLLRAPGPAPHPAEVWWMRLHGAALLGFLVVLGTVMPAHILYGWRHRMNRGSGIPVLILATVLIVTGYGLYYLVADDWRSWTSAAHWIAGVVSIAVVTLHAILGKRESRARIHAAGHTAHTRTASNHPGRRQAP
jgi:hypothetical protein